MSAEAAAIRLGGTVAMRAARLWLGPKERDQQARSAMEELIRVRVAGLRAQRSVKRQFEQISDAVAARVQPLIEHEFRGLTEEGRAAVLEAVVSTFATADLSDRAVLGSDSDSAELARRIRASAPVPDHFSEVETRFYEVVFGECCDCYVRVLRRLPVFTERAVAELLARATSLGDELEKVLERLPARSLFAPDGTSEDEAFRREYLGLVSRSLDEIELFGLGPSERAPRTTLSVAYVSLRASADSGLGRPDPARPPLPTSPRQRGDHDADRASGTRVEAALEGSPRVLLRGEAGSGKTTLLQWLAVTAARGAFTGALADWNGLIPVLIRLRQYAESALPAPQDMLDRAAPPLAGLMPVGWMHRAFADGRVLLLVDGVDELLTDPRRGIRDWLRGLLHSYPDTRVVVTSRPAEERLEWLRAEGFGTLHLERMTPADLTSFIRQWHQAVRVHEADLPCPQEELPRYERSLLTSLQDRPHLASLAMNPLLAALLCALHLARRGQLPRNRMELYRMALEVLVQQRDADRGVRSELPVPLTLTDKLYLLRDLAWRLSDNNHTEIDVDRAAEHVTTKLAGMRHLQELEGPAVLEHLVHRSGVLRSPVEGRLDFLHRTFQEYLAAGEATAEDRIGNLVERAHLDLWRETVVMAAGHASRRQQEELLGGILDRAALEPRHTRRLWLVAAACQETMPSVPYGLAARLDSVLAQLVPPRRQSEAESLAAVGTPLLKRLPRSLESLSDAAAEATVATAIRIGGVAALARLADYAADGRGRVRQLLAAGWEYFDAEDYAHAVLRQLPLDSLTLHITHSGQWATATRLTDARWIVVDCPLLQDMARLHELPPLRGLFLNDLSEDADLSPLHARTDLEVLGLAGAARLRNARLDGLGRLSALAVRLRPSMPPLAELAVPASLVTLELNRLPAGYDLSPLATLPGLERLALVGSGPLRDIGEPLRWEDLQALDLSGYDLTDWAPLREDLPSCLRLVSDCVVPPVPEPRAGCTILNCRTPDDRPHPLNVP